MRHSNIWISYRIPYQIFQTPVQYVRSHAWPRASAPAECSISAPRSPPLLHCWASTFLRHLDYYPLHLPQLLQSVLLLVLGRRPHHLAVRWSIPSLSSSDQAYVCDRVCIILVPRGTRRHWLRCREGRIVGHWEAGLVVLRNRVQAQT